MPSSDPGETERQNGPVDRDVFIHDLKNVMAGALGHLSLARKRVANDEAVSHSLTAVENILRGACSMAEVALSPKKPSLAEDLSVLDVISICAGICVPPEKISLRLTHGENLPLVLAPPDKLQQLFNNLLTNSVEAMEEGGTIKIHLGRESPDRRQDDPTVLRITISDSGPGISPEMREKIFEPGFSTREGGSGVGLASARDSLQQMGGEIFVDPEVNSGATFIVRLPGEKKVDPRTRPVGRPVMKSEGRVLLLDDDAMILEITEEMLNQLGWSVVICGDGREAAERYREAKEAGDPFDLVVIDLNVPRGIGGVEAADLIRQYDPKARMWVSSGQDAPIMNHPGDYGFSGSLRKPYSLEELSVILK